MIKYVDFSNSEITKVKRQDLVAFKSQLNINIDEGGKPRYRYCLHRSPEEAVHEMIMCVTKNDYVRPHKHNKTIETNLLFEGKILAVFFDENGIVKEALILGKEEYFIFRIDCNIYHMTIPLTDTALFYEVKKGPFDSKDNIYAEWAPEEDDVNAVIKFIEKIKEEVKIFGGNNDEGYR